MLLDPLPTTVIPPGSPVGSLLALADAGYFYEVPAPFLDLPIVWGNDYTFRLVAPNRVERVLDGKMFEWNGQVTLPVELIHPPPDPSPSPGATAYIGYLVPSGFVALPGGSMTHLPGSLAHPEKFLPLYFLQSDIDKWKAAEEAHLQQKMLAFGQHYGSGPSALPALLQEPGVMAASDKAKLNALPPVSGPNPFQKLVEAAFAPAADAAGLTLEQTLGANPFPEVPSGEVKTGPDWSPPANAPDYSLFTTKLVGFSKIPIKEVDPGSAPEPPKAPDYSPATLELVAGPPKKPSILAAIQAKAKAKKTP